MSIERAFHAICQEAINHRPRGYHVSLYEDVPYYGGPEEGGWWGHDTVLLASQEFDTEEAAQAALERVKKFAAELEQDARSQYGERCRAELDWCEARGIDDSNSVFGEVDGPSKYVVRIENYPGEHVYRGERFYS